MKVTAEFIKRIESGDVSTWIYIEDESSWPREAKKIVRPRTHRQMLVDSGKNMRNWSTLQMLDVCMFTDGHLLMRIDALVAREMLGLCKSLGITQWRTPSWGQLWKPLPDSNGFIARVCGVREEISEEAASYILKDTDPRPAQVLLRNMSGRYAVLNARYYAEVMREHPGATWRFDAHSEPVQAFDGDKLVAVVMPFDFYSQVVVWRKDTV